MTLPATITRPIVVLSYGRTGSMLLTHNIGQLLNADPVTIQIKTLDQMPIVPLNNTPIHTHIQASKSVFDNYTQIYNLRYDPVETILSKLLANTFDHYHQFNNQDIVNHNSFEFVKWSWLSDICQKFIDWHNHYREQLSSDDHVVIYEKYVDAISNRTSVYKKLYPDKDSLLSNYNQVCEFIIVRYLDKMLASIDPFLKHQNTIDIYQLL